MTDIEAKRHRVTYLSPGEVEQYRVTKGEFKRNADELFAYIKYLNNLSMKLGASPTGSFTEQLYQSVPDPTDPTGRRTITQLTNVTINREYIRQALMGIEETIATMVKNFATKSLQEAAPAPPAPPAPMVVSTPGGGTTVISKLE